MSNRLPPMTPPGTARTRRSPWSACLLRLLCGLRKQPGGCDQPAAGCEVHHLRHRKDGGPTSVKDCALFCFFHHQVVIHQWGWTVVLNPDGTTTAWNNDKTKIIHSHSPPVRPG